MRQKKVRKRYSFEYKQEAIELSKKLGASQASKQLDIPLSCLQRWKSQKNIPVEKSQDVVKLQAEVRRLKKELSEEKAVVEMLKKATAFFSKENAK